MKLASEMIKCTAVATKQMCLQWENEEVQKPQIVIAKSHCRDWQGLKERIKRLCNFGWISAGVVTTEWLMKNGWIWVVFSGSLFMVDAVAIISAAFLKRQQQLIFMGNFSRGKHKCVARTYFEFGITKRRKEYGMLKEKLTEKVIKPLEMTMQSMVRVWSSQASTSSVQLKSIGLKYVKQWRLCSVSLSPFFSLHHSKHKSLSLVERTWRTYMQCADTPYIFKGDDNNVGTCMFLNWPHPKEAASTNLF